MMTERKDGWELRPQWDGADALVLVNEQLYGREIRITMDDAVLDVDVEVEKYGQAGCLVPLDLLRKLLKDHDAR